MKRFGTAVLDPRDVRALAPAPALAGIGAATGVPRHYLMLFLSGSVLTVDAESAAALSDALVDEHSPQPNRTHA